MRDRRGANAIEFALVLPVFLTIVLGMMEFSWAFFIRTAVITAVSDGCRAGAVVHPEDDWETEALDRMTLVLAQYNIDCEDNSVSCESFATSSGDSPEESIDCRLEVNYEPLIGYVPVPTEVASEATILFELQR
ncbi:MAG: pilus assembly protein [Proteobacteria bacterium]|nr:pilus assembly protein [Pseudomonadota bacterium]MCP4918920.1 pilus assembly protein [Pseudomonadota bacterium]